ncbi:MAG: AEC family transporter [Pseudomonadota bacterium]
MLQIELILVSLAIGVLLRWSGAMPETAPKVLAGWVINVALPATALKAVHDVEFELSWMIAAATPWLSALVAILVFGLLAGRVGWDRERAGALILVGGWGNTSFVGLPMIAALAGSQWLGLGLVIDLFGSYLALSILGIAVATVCGGDGWNGRVVLRRILTFPPFIAIVVALVTNHLDRPPGVEATLSALSATLTPLALAAVGYAIRLDRLAGRLWALAAGLGFRLVLAPLLAVAGYGLLGDLKDPVAQVAILEMAMPPMLGASVIAIEHGLEPDLVALLIGIGIPLSMVTVPVWWWAIGS